MQVHSCESASVQACCPSSSAFIVVSDMVVGSEDNVCHNVTSFNYGTLPFQSVHLDGRFVQDDCVELIDQADGDIILMKVPATSQSAATWLTMSKAQASCSTTV